MANLEDVVTSLERKFAFEASVRRYNRPLYRVARRCGWLVHGHESHHQNTRRLNRRRQQIRYCPLTNILQSVLTYFTK